MATDAQIRANRLNAMRSTGPRTQEGKDRARFNALKHGLAAECVVLPSEDMGAYFELRAALLSQYQPQNPAEIFLVDQMAQNWWRLNRSRRYETGLLAKLDTEEAPTYTDLDHHRRYEAAIERAYYRAYDRIEKIVRRRPVSPPSAPAEPECSSAPLLGTAAAASSTPQIGFVPQMAPLAVGFVPLPADPEHTLSPTANPEAAALRPPHRDAA